jgi:UDP-GlcNAc:undecaprenyl-phosphate GlcNAc-1-phosphate transferase
MGLPISDTAMAIFRRWVRNLPLSSADRRHVHHLLIGLGLNPRQAALMLYCFSGFLCGVVLLGVALRNEILALILGISGCLAFLLILTSRLDELSSLRGDFRARIARGRQERFAARATWEAIQRIELCDRAADACQILEETGRKLGCALGSIACARGGRTVTLGAGEADRDFEAEPAVSGSSAIFRLSGGQDLTLTVSLHQGADSTLAADIAFRFLRRLAETTADRLDQLLAAGQGTGEPTVAGAPAASPGEPTQAVKSCSTTTGLTTQAAPVLALTAPAPTHTARNRLRVATRWESRPVAHQPSLGDE